MEFVYRPEFLQLQSSRDRIRYHEIMDGRASIVYDTVESQLMELFKVRNPHKDPEISELRQFTEHHLNGMSIDDFGVWVYYPWSKKFVHLLPADQFIEIRTNRNKLKITEREQSTLSNKRVGIVGLSVGQSIALTMAMERICGTLRLADYDVVELSNLNRIRTGVHNLSVNKAVLAAREIAEIDPFIGVEVFSEGLNSQNIADFLDAGGGIDLLVEVCDNMETKLKSRVEARTRRIPLIMETNDRGMLDVERFDLEPDRPILHGLVSEEEVKNSSNLSNDQKLEIVMKIVEPDNLSARMKQSFGEIGKTLRSWPQLASSVVLGGGVVTDVSRKLLLGENVKSGRYYVDIDQILHDI